MVAGARFVKDIPAPPQLVFASGLQDSTDRLAIQSALASGPVLLVSPLYFWDGVAPIVLPDGTNGTKRNGTLNGLNSIIRCVPGANPTGPCTTSANMLSAGTPSSGHVPVFMNGITIDMNMANQSYGPNPAWAVLGTTTGASTEGEFPAWGPDAIITLNSGSQININTTNWIRHGVVSSDVSYLGTGAVGGADNCTWSGYHSGVYGDGGTGGTVPSLSCTTTAGSSAMTSTAASLPTGLVVGSVPWAAGILPNTVVMSITGSSGAWTINLNQNATVGATVTVLFGLSMRPFWNTNLTGSAGCTDSYLMNFQSNGSWGDYMVKNDNAGGWTISNPHCFDNAYHGARFLFGTNTTVAMGAGMDNLGEKNTTGNILVAATLNQTLTAGTTYSQITVNALPCTLQKWTVLQIPGAGPSGGPLYVTLTQTGHLSATTLYVYNFTPSTTVTAGLNLTLPLTGTICHEFNDSNILPGLVVCKERPSNDYLYWCFIGNNVLAPFTVSACTYSGPVGGLYTVTLVISASNGMYAGQTIVVAGVGGVTNVNGTFTLVSLAKNTPTAPEATITYNTTNAPTGTYTSGGTVAPTLVSNLNLASLFASNLSNANVGNSSCGLALINDGSAWNIRGAGQCTTRGKITTAYYASDSAIVYADNTPPGAVQPLGWTGTFDVAAAENLAAGAVTFAGQGTTALADITTGVPSGGAAPTIAAQTPAGSGATATIAGTDVCGYITIVTGTGPTSGTQAIVTFNKAKTGPARVCLTPAGTSQRIAASVVPQGASGGSYTAPSVGFAISTAALAASTTYTYFYMVME